MTNNVKVVVENRGSGAADYEVLIAQVGRNGSQVTTRVGHFLAVQPGQTASVTVFGENLLNAVDLRNRRRQEHASVIAVGTRR